MESTQSILAGGTHRTEAGLGLTQQVAPPGSPPLTLTALAGNRFALSTRLTTEHLLFRVASTGAASGQRRPLNLCLAIDRSGSMEGEPLAYVKQACAHILDLLGPEDVLSIVTFEDTVDVVVPARRVVNRDLLKQHVQRIVSGRTTNLYDGLVASFAQVASAAGGDAVSRVLLLTDGEPTAGLRDFQSIVALVAEQKARGIGVTALGFGPEYNEELLAGIARRGGGAYYYIPRPDLIPEVFRKELQTLFTVQATDLRLRVSVPRWVAVRQVYGHQPSFAGRSVEVPLVDLEAGRSVSVLLELELQPRPAGCYRVAVGELSAVHAGSAVTLSAEAALDFVTDPERVAAGAVPEVAREVDLARASRDLEKTVMGMRTQQITVAAAVAGLERTQALLAASGRAGEAAQVAQALGDLRSGSAEGVEKTLIGTVLGLDQGKG